MGGAVLNVFGLLIFFSRKSYFIVFGDLEIVHFVISCVPLRIYCSSEKCAYGCPYQTLDHFTNICNAEIKLKEKAKTNANYNPMFLASLTAFTQDKRNWHSDPGLTLMLCTSLNHCHKCKTKLKKSWVRPVDVQTEHRNEKKGIKASWKVVNMVVGGSLAVLSVLQTAADLLGFSQHHSRRWGWRRRDTEREKKHQLSSSCVEEMPCWWIAWTDWLETSNDATLLGTQYKAFRKICHNDIKKTPNYYLKKF